MEPAEAPAPRSAHLILRIFLLLFSLSEFVTALFNLPRLQESFSHPTPGWRLASHVSDARTALAPLIAGAAFDFTIAGRLPRAVAAMAALILVNALVELAWAIAMRGASVPLDLLGAHMLANRYVYPLLAVASLVLLRHGTRHKTNLGLAGTLVLIPTGVVWLYYIMLFALIATDPD